MSPSRNGVRQTYDRIATHFSATREYPWPEVEAFLADRSGRIGFDAGCGNGRHAELLQDHVDRVIGLDVSRGILDTARLRATDRNFEVDLLQGDAISLPIESDRVDLAISIATIHHLPSRAGRQESLGELARVLAPSGVSLVSAWSTAHDRFDASRTDDAGIDTTLEWTLPNDETIDRYYHIYAPAEFEADLNAGGLEIESSFLSSGNCYAVVRPALATEGKG
ncbi:MAG: tRNA (uracil-5-)-methyltransferase TRM9 [Halobacteriales archaeon]